MVELFSIGRAWVDFRDLENEFVKALDYVPLREAHDSVWSPKFGRLLDETGSAVDSFFRVVIEDGSRFSAKQSSSKLDIKDYQRLVNPVYRLSDAKVQVSDGVSNYGEVVPFAAFAHEKEFPEWWWSAYNKYKHYRYSLIDYANLRNVAEALSGLFLLNILHKENQEYLVGEDVIHGPAGFGSKMILANLKKSNFGAPTQGYMAKSSLFSHEFRVDSGQTPTSTSKTGQ